MTLEQIPDVLGEPWTAETITLPSDDEGEVVATLVARRAAEPTDRAVLHVHGFADYFFQAEYAEWWVERGYDFYALDLRKAGRSTRPGQTPHYVTDLRDYYAELDEAWKRVTARDGHSAVVTSAHSTGGLTLPIWANERRPEEHLAMVLNSPWFDLQGGFLLRTVGTEVIRQVGRRQPRRVIPREVSGLYTRSLHKDHEGEWDFDLTWKPVESFRVHAGWLRAIRDGHSELHHGLNVPVPVLVLTSGATRRPRKMGADVHSSDLVLDVPQIRKWATCVGPHVTYVAVPGARHDVVLSVPDVRKRVYDELDRWHAAYVGAVQPPE